MYAKLIKTKGAWRDVADIARATVGKEAGEGEPSDSWKEKIIRAEHSPIREISFTVCLYDLPYWVSVHLVRHKIGIEHYVRTQRTDRTGVDRTKLPQDALVNHTMTFNIQAAITISRKRLCSQAAFDTQEAWDMVIDCLPQVIRKFCVPECVYRGFCPEMNPCGFTGGHTYQVLRQKYTALT